MLSNSMDEDRPFSAGDIEKYYDLTAERTAREWYPNDILLPVERDLMAQLPPRPTILDLGCGPGYESMRLHALGADVTGVDISAESIRIARSRNPACRFLRMDFSALDPSIGQFNAVWASGSLIHVPPESMGRLLALVRGLLTGGGILAALLRDGSGSIVSSPVINGTRFERIVFRYTGHELDEHCRQSGFRHVKNGVLEESLQQSGWRCYFYRKT